jgi:hypothetical protein
VLGIPRRDRLAAIGLWTLAGGWCAKQLTDGYLAKHMLEEIGGSPRLASTLVEVGLWEVSEGGYQFHDWDHYNPTREEVEADRTAARERMKRIRSGRSSGGSSPEVRANNKRSSDQVRDPRPDPTRPEVPDGTSSVVPEHSKPASMPRSRGAGTRIPDPFIVDEAMRDWAVDRGYTAEWCMQQTERFINYWTAKPGKDGTKSDWRATWRNWILKAADDLPPYSGQAATRRPNGPDSGLFDRAMERAQQRLEIVQ